MKKRVMFLVLILSIILCTKVEAKGLYYKEIKANYDENTSIQINQTDVKGFDIVFDDINQVVSYDVTVKNTGENALKITELYMSKSNEKYLDYKVEGIEIGDKINPDTTKTFKVIIKTTNTPNREKDLIEDFNLSIKYEMYEDLYREINSIQNPNTKDFNIIIITVSFLIAGFIFYKARKNMLF